MRQTSGETAYIRFISESADSSIMQEFTARIIEVIRDIPEGKVATYGQVARLAGNHRGARQVVRTLKTQTRKNDLPWFRVINSKGRISIRDEVGFEEQRARLIGEGVEVTTDGQIDLGRYQWEG